MIYDINGNLISADVESTMYIATDHGISAEATNNSTALQTLVNTVAAAGGGTIFFPIGTYHFTATVTMASNVSIVGENMEKTIFHKNRTGSWTLFNYAGTTEKPITGCHYECFTVDEYDTGNNNVVSAKSFFYRYVKDCVWRDIILKGSIATALGIDFLDNVLIENVTCIDCGRTFTGSEAGTSGIGIGTGGWENENFRISNCVCVGCGQFGIFIENQKTVFGTGNVNYSKGSIISNCVVRNGLNHGIGIRGGQNVTVIGCESYENAKSGFSVESLCENVKITGCSAAQNTESGIRLSQSTSSDHVAIVNNTCVNNSGNGIAVETATNGLCVVNNYTDGNACGLSIGALTLTDAVVKNNCTIDGVTNGATFNGNTSFVDVAS